LFCDHRHEAQSGNSSRPTIIASNPVAPARTRQTDPSKSRNPRGLRPNENHDPQAPEIKVFLLLFFQKKKNLLFLKKKKQKDFISVAVDPKGVS
jgi:hypothetical protein